MTIIDRLINKIKRLDDKSPIKKIYDDIYCWLFSTLDNLSQETDTRISDLIVRVQFDEHLDNDFGMLAFYTTLNDGTIKYLFRFNLYKSHYEFTLLY